MSPLCAARAAVRVYAAGAAVILAQLLRRLRGALPEPAGNNERKSQEAVRTIKEETLNNKVEFLYCDLASMSSIRHFVRQFKAKNIPLHVLVNNAGVMMVPQRTTRDGFEEHFGVNYLGHFLLTNLLLDTLKESGSPGCCARVVTVSSATHYVGELNMEDLQSSCGYSPAGAYAQSKLALVLFTYHLQSLLASSGSHVTANAVDPGVVNTDLYRHVFWGTWLVKRLLGWLLFKKQITKPFFRATSGWTPTSSLSTPDEGARTSIYAAVAPELEGVGGRYLYNEEATQSLQITYDKKLQRQLWARSCEMTRVLDVTQDGLAG
ncbi:dehydrogenase/reductase SDR family member on chromosome X isoform X4 [Elephas maximus indicus]|uniref:dehydrogenase/reductase SDR family member on chromosome X isoform X4 n=1 Tax=Elephas maximus indicus TaxID=99487 RepID=UPI002116659B|nr:dehydrogenase/reductase SDR family member on chromosome X isoform X4 [Elephas maximus indicus]